MKFREQQQAEARYCRLARTTERLPIGDKEFQLTPGTTISHFTFLAGDLTDMGDCSLGVMDMARARSWVAQAVYEIGISQINLLIEGLEGETILDPAVQGSKGVQGDSWAAATSSFHVWLSVSHQPV